MKATAAIQKFIGLKNS